MKMRSRSSIQWRRGVTSLTLALTAVITGTPIPMFAADTDKPWTTVGSAGTVDANNLSIYSTNDKKHIGERIAGAGHPGCSLQHRLGRRRGAAGQFGAESVST